MSMLATSYQYLLSRRCSTVAHVRFSSDSMLQRQVFAVGPLGCAAPQWKMKGPRWEKACSDVLSDVSS